MDTQKSWRQAAVYFIGWLFIVLGLLTFGDRQNKLDQRIFELEKRVREIETTKP